MAAVDDNSEDRFFAECTRLYNAKAKLEDPLRKTHKVVFVHAGPELLGHPSRRPRSLTAGLSLRSLIWIGPQDPEQVQLHFNSLFARSIELTGCVYFKASPDALRRFAQAAMKRRRGVCLDGAVMQKMNTTGRDFLESFFPPGGLQRLEMYLSRQAELQGLDGTYIVDTEQWATSKAAAAGPMFPTQLTHGTIVNCDDFRLALGTDHLSANGFALYPEFTRDVCSSMAPILLELSDNEQKELSGNGQNLPAILAWFMYVFSHTLRRPTLELMSEPSAMHSHGCGEEAGVDNDDAE